MTVLSVVLPFKCSTTSSESGIRKLASPYYIGLAKDRNPESGISSRWSNPKPKHVWGHSGIWNLEFHLVQPKTNALVGTADVLAAAQTRPVRDSAIAVARDRYHRRRPPCCTSARSSPAPPTCSDARCNLPQSHAISRNLVLSPAISHASCVSVGWHSPSRSRGAPGELSTKHT